MDDKQIDKKPEGIKIKLCGLKRPEDINYANEYIPDYAGFVFAGFKRKISPEHAAMLISRLDKEIWAVGIFVNEDIESLISTVRQAGINVVQLQGDEDAEYILEIKKRLHDIEVWKAVRVKSEDDIILAEKLPADKLLLDAFSANEYGGTGKTADLEQIKKVSGKLTKPFFLAGGININNMKFAADEVSPYGLDISSGVETDGCKDKEKIKAVVQLVREMK